MLNSGMYSLVYHNGEYRTIKVKDGRIGGALEGKTILSIKDGADFVGVAFMDAKNNVRFWRKFREQNPPERLARILRAVHTILAEPRAAQLAYAMKEGRCARCGKELTVPASIHNGLGPECAKRSWTKKDNQLVFSAKRAETEARA